MKLDVVPAVAELGKPATVSEEAGAAAMVIFDSVPVMDEVAVSVAAIDWIPAVSNATVKVCTPALADVKV